VTELRELHDGQIQNWRAMAYMADRTQMLVLVADSAAAVEEHFWKSLGSTVGVRSVWLEQWHGIPDCGKWVAKKRLYDVAVSSVAEVAGAA
jgi:hypothetical protein